MTAPVPPAPLVVHRRDLLFTPRLCVIFEDDDFASWPPSSMTEYTSGWELLDRERDGVYLLHELRADHLRDGGPPPEPVINMRVFAGEIPVSASIRRRNSRTFSGWRVSCRW